MASKFDIIISATDKATGTFNKLNDKLEQFNKPFKALNKSMSTFTNESGLKRVGESFGKLRNKAANLAGSIGSIVAPLAAVAGLASVAGIINLASTWGRAAQSLSNTSAMIGVATGKLQEYRGAARLAGLSSEDMDGSLRALGNTIHDAKWGRNAGALAMMRDLGLSFKMNKDGSTDTIATLRDLADKIAKLKGNVQTQGRIADAFGVGALLPLLQQGSAGVDELIAKYDKLGVAMGPQQIRNAQEYAENMTAFDMTLENLRDTIGNALIPVLTPLMASLGEWISKNKQLIAGKIAEWAQKIADWLKNIDFARIASELGRFIDIAVKGVDAVGGIKNVLIAIAGIQFGGVILGIGQLALQIGGLAARLTGLSAAGAGLMGLAGQAGAVGLAGAGGYGIGWTLNKGMGWLSEKMSDGKYQGDGWLGSMLSDAVNGNASDKLLNSPNASRFSGLEKKNGLPAGLLDSVWNVESGRGANMVSPAGALGHFQFMPKTAEQYGVTDPFNLDQSAAGASMMFHDLMGHYNGDSASAIAAYNWGQGNVDSWLKTGKGVNGQPMPQETVNYVKKVSAGMGAGSLFAGGGSNGSVAYESGSGAGGAVEVMVRFVNPPAGMQQTVKTRGNVVASTRIGHSLEAATV